MRLLLVLIASTCLWSSAGHAQLRAIPDQAKGGEIRHVQDAIVSINGVELRLAPGAQIRDESNRLLVPTAVPAGAQVKYLVDEQGLVRRVWILTPEEGAKRGAVNN